MVERADRQRWYMEPVASVFYSLASLHKLQDTYITPRIKMICEHFYKPLLPKDRVYSPMAGLTVPALGGLAHFLKTTSFTSENLNKKLGFGQTPHPFFATLVSFSLKKV